MEAEYLVNVGLQDFVWMMFSIGVALVSFAVGGMIGMVVIRKKEEKNSGLIDQGEDSPTESGYPSGNRSTH